MELESKGGALQKILSTVTFNCKNRHEGYYSDIEFNCQIFHYCKQNAIKFTFVCPSNSIFNQQEMSCDYNLPNFKQFCQDSSKYYYLNSILYKQRRKSYNQTANNHSVLLAPQQQSTNQHQHQHKHKHETDLNNPKFEPLIMPYNNTKWISNAVKPFWGYKFTQNQLNTSSGDDKSTVKQVASVGKYANSNEFRMNSPRKKFVPQNKNNVPIISIMNNLKEKEKQNFFTEENKEITTESMTKQPINFTSENFHWDQIENPNKMHFHSNQMHGFKQYFTQPSNQINIGHHHGGTFVTTYPMTQIGAPPSQSSSVQQMVVVKPHFPVAVPVATVYKPDNYMFGKPHPIKSLYINPPFETALIHPQIPMQPTIYRDSSDNIPKYMRPQPNSNLIQHFQSSLVNLPHYNLLNIPYQTNYKRIDNPSNGYHNSRGTEKPIKSKRITSLIPNQEKNTRIINSLINNKFLGLPSFAHLYPRQQLLGSSINSNTNLVRNHFQSSPTNLKSKLNGMTHPSRKPTTSTVSTTITTTTTTMTPFTYKYIYLKNSFKPSTLTSTSTPTTFVPPKLLKPQYYSLKEEDSIKAKYLLNPSTYMNRKRDKIKQNTFIQTKSNQTDIENIKNDESALKLEKPLILNNSNNNNNNNSNNSNSNNNQTSLNEKVGKVLTTEVNTTTKDYEVQTS